MILKTDGNGKLVRAMGRHSFPGISPAKVWDATAFTFQWQQKRK